MLGEGICFMRERLQKLKHKAKQVFSPRVRVVFGVIGVIISLWFFSRYVLAEKEANVFIFPSNITADGWDNADASLSQDLSSDAELVDFSRENSSFVFFGAPLETVSTTTNAIATNTPPETLIPSISPATDTGVTPTLGTDPFPSLVPIGTPDNSDATAAPTDGTSTGIQSAISSLLHYARAISAPRHAFALVLPTSTDSPQLAAPNLAPVPVETTYVDEIPAESETATTSETVSATTTVSLSEPTPQSSDPYSVALCTTLGRECHILEYDGFGLGGALEKHPLTGATLELSLAGHASFSRTAYDRVLVRAYHKGRWEFLGEEEVRGEISNAKRGGYLHFDLSSLEQWGDLSDLKIVVEYDRASG